MDTYSKSSSNAKYVTIFFWKKLSLEPANKEYQKIYLAF